MLKPGYVLIILPILIGGLGLAVEHLGSFYDLKNYVNGRTIPSALVHSGKGGKELRLLEYGTLTGVQLQDFANDLQPTATPSSQILEARARDSGLPSLSIIAGAEELLDPQSGILVNFLQRGRSWERAAYVSYFQDGELRFSSGVGLRVHGGKSREMPRKSLRLHFRELYGVPSVSSDVLFDGKALPLRSVVVHSDLRERPSGVKWHFMNPLAYELARAIGCIAPRTQPVALYLNGDYQGLYILTEHLSPEYFQARLGHSNFVMARTKRDTEQLPATVEMGDPRLYRAFRDWAADGNVDIAELSQRVDLENLTNWMISILFAGVTDPFQGPIILDTSDPNAKWYWVNWDMDHAFMDVYDQAPEPWDIDIFAGPLQSKRDPRSAIFDRLTRESPEYRAYFLNRITEVLNHILTDDFLNERLAYYEGVSRIFGLDDTRFLSLLGEYLQNRSMVLRTQLDTYFSSGPSFKLTTSISGEADLKIDGYRVADEYRGHYFFETPVSIEISTVDDPAFTSWIINGQISSIDTPYLTLNLAEDTHIEVVLLPESHPAQ